MVSMQPLCTDKQAALSSHVPYGFNTPMERLLMTADRKSLRPHLAEPGGIRKFLIPLAILCTLEKW